LKSLEKICPAELPVLFTLAGLFADLCEGIVCLGKQVADLA